jgi:hypothetical protein
MKKRLSKSIINQALRQHLAGIAPAGGRERAKKLGPERVAEIAKKASEAALKARKARKRSD